MARFLILALAVAALALPSTTAKVADPVTDVDFDAYVGRWYNVYYDKFTTLFSSPDCSTAYYELDPTASVSTITVNNSGTEDGESTFITGYAAVQSEDTPGDLTLHLEGVSQDATYRIIALGEKTFDNKYYQYSIVTDDSGLSLYVLCRDVDDFMANYDDEVQALLKDFGYTGFFFGVSANDQTDCPSDIYYPQWNPSAAEKKALWYRRSGGSTCTGTGEFCCEAPNNDVDNCPSSAQTDDCTAIGACCCG